MKYIWLLFLCIAYFAKAQEILDLPLNGDASDVSLYKNHGIFHGPKTIVTDRFGRPCEAIYFNGYSNYIEIPHIKRYDKIKNEFSVTAWIKLPRNLNNPITWLSLICKGRESLENEDNPAFRVQLMQSQTQSTVSISTDFTENDLGFNQHQFPRGRWFFFALVYNGSTVQYFIDQVLVFNFPYSRSLRTNNSPFYLGLDVPGASEWFQGALDDFRLFDFALSKPELESLRLEKARSFSANSNWQRICIADTTLFANESCEAKFSYDVPSLMSDCKERQAKKLKGPDSGTWLKKGTYELVFEMAELGPKVQSRLCSTTINVTDIISPRFLPIKDTIIFLKGAIPDGYKLFYDFPEAVDNCSVVDVIHISGPKPGEKFKLGENIVVFKAVDKAGNFTYLEKKIILRTTVLSDSIEVRDSLALSFDEPYTLVFFDDGREDNDTVSIFWNGTEILHRVGLTKRKTGVHIMHVIPKLGNPNILVSKAWNTGGVPPNTLKFFVIKGVFANYEEIKRTKPLYQRSIHSKPGLSGAIKFMPYAK
jgi:hypothetical protein